MPPSPELISSRAYSRSTYWLSTSTGRPGVFVRASIAAVSPSVVNVGGMRTSTMARSTGWCSSNAAANAVGSPTAATTSMSLACSSRVSPSRRRARSSAMTTRTAPPSSRSSAPRPGCSGRRCRRRPRAAGRCRPDPCRRCPRPGGPRRGHCRDDHDDPAIAVLEVGPGPARPGVLDHVGQALRRREVERGLDRGRHRSRDVGGNRDRYRDVQGQSLDRPGEPPIGQHRRVDAVHDVAQLVQGRYGAGPRLVEQVRGRVRVGLDQASGQPEAHRQRDHAGLGAVVQVALDAAQLGGLDVQRATAGSAQHVDALQQFPLALRGEPVQHPGVDAEQGGQRRDREDRPEPAEPAEQPDDHLEHGDHHRDRAVYGQPSPASHPLLAGPRDGAGQAPRDRPPHPDPSRPEVALTAHPPDERRQETEPGGDRRPEAKRPRHAATAWTAGVRTARRLATLAVATVTTTATTATIGNSHGHVVGRNPDVLTTVYGITAPSDATPPTTMPVAAMSAASIPAIDVTCSRVEPASRCRPNSRRRAAIVATSVLTTMIAAKTHTMPTTTRLSSSTLLVATSCAAS